MKITALSLAVAAAASAMPALAGGDGEPPAAPAAATTSTAPPAMLSYDGDKLRAPSDYREWIYVTTGIDMSYNRVAPPDHHMFDSVFVDPVAWQAFKRTGSWPEKTTFVLETRGAQSKGSINKRGYYQDADLMGVEVHVKDTSRFDGDGWAFFTFEDTGKPAAIVPRDAACYACHRAHGAVDSTFVQFYPTALPVARARGTLAPGYLKELADGPAAN
jgi:Cytochrome P460